VSFGVVSQLAWLLRPTGRFLPLFVSASVSLKPVSLPVSVSSTCFSRHFADWTAFYLSSWYKRYELASRFAIYYTATAVAGAFSGLLAGLITKNLDGTRGLAGWQWLFVSPTVPLRVRNSTDLQLIEGVASSALGFFTWMILPDWPSTTKGLTDAERLIASQRLAYDGMASTQGATEQLGHWEACKVCFKDWKVWILVVMVSNFSLSGAGQQLITVHALYRCPNHAILRAYSCRCS